MSDFDFSDVERLSVSIGRASAAMVTEARAVVAKGLLNIKSDARERVSDHPTWKQLARTINYEQVGLSGEVGYDDVGQGELAGIAEFGSVRHAPHPALMPASREESPKFAKAMGDAAAKVLGNL